MDFSAALKSDFEERVKPRVERRNQLRAEITGIKKQIETEEQAVEQQQQSIDKLEEGIGESLAKGGEHYNQLAASIDLARDAINKTEKRLAHLRSLPSEREAEFHQSLRRLEEIRVLVARENLPMVQEQINGHVEMILDLYDRWITTHMAAAQADGDGFTVPRDCQPRIDHHRLQEKGDIRSLPGEEYTKILREEQEQVNE